MPKGGKKEKKRKDIDWAAEDHFEKNRAMVYIEHTTECPIYQTKAEEFARFLVAEFPDRIIQLIRNQNGKLLPREGSFEIGFSQNARTSIHNLWSGIEKGPPRRDKFPDFSTLIPEVRQILKKFYPDLTVVHDDEMDD